MCQFRKVFSKYLFGAPRDVDFPEVKKYLTKTALEKYLAEKVLKKWYFDIKIVLTYCLKGQSKFW